MTIDLNQIYKSATLWIVQKGPAFLTGILVLLVGLWLINVLSRVLRRGMDKKSIDPSLKPFLLSLVVSALRVLLIIGAMQIIGIQMTVFAAIIAAMGVAAGLALSGTLQNFASGIIILFVKPFSVGDNIIAQGQEGTVTAIRIFYTLVTTFDNKTVIIPNGKLSNEIIINLSKMGSRRLDIELKFSNALDFNEVKEHIDKTIDQSGETFASADHRIGISSIEPDGYKVMVNVWLNAHGFVDAKMKFQQMLLQNLRSSGLKLQGM